MEKEPGEVEGDGEVTYELDLFHEKQIEMLHSRLWQRRQDLKRTAVQTSAAVGRRRDFIYRLENRQREDQRVSSLQDWCRGLDARLRLWVPEFPPSLWPWQLPVDRFAREHQALWQYWNLSTVDGDRMIPDLSQRCWVPALLRAYRRHTDPSDARLKQLCADLGMNAKGLWKWEAEATDPSLRRCMRYAQALGVQLRVDVSELEPAPDELRVDVFEQWRVS